MGLRSAFGSRVLASRINLCDELIQARTKHDFLALEAKAEAEEVIT